MNVVLLLISLLLLALIAWFDIRHRSVPLVFFLLEIAVAIGMMALSGISGYWQMILLSVLIAGFQLIMIWGWFRLVRKTNGFFDSLFGWGDLVMIAIAAIHFSPFPFILFMIVSSLAGLLWYYLRKLIIVSSSYTVPLAGIMALLLMPVQVTGFLGKSWFYLNHFAF
jgi:hypothetical protein